MKITCYKEAGSSMGYEDYHRTFDGLLRSIFPDIQDFRNYNGVEFRSLIDGGWPPRVKGVSIESGSYGNTIRRRVMIASDDTIDDDKVRAKYEECRLHAIEDTKTQDIAIQKQQRIEAAFSKLLTDIGLDSRDRYGEVWAETETSVHISGEVQWFSLKDLADLLGTDIKVSVRLSVPIEKAKEAYQIIYSEETTKDN